MEKSAWGQGSLEKVNIITLATLLPTPIIISLGMLFTFQTTSRRVQRLYLILNMIWSKLAIVNIGRFKCLNLTKSQKKLVSGFRKGKMQMTQLQKNLLQENI